MREESGETAEIRQPRLPLAADMDGALLRTVVLPVSLPTMCAFGGPDLRTLFVASASDQLTPAQRAREPLAGALFRFDPGVRGTPKATRAR